MMTLAEYLSQAAVTPFGYGNFDCQLYLADWVQIRRNIDLAAPWRGKYKGQREASRLLSHYGGMEALIDHAVCGVLEPTDVPVPGDIAIVRPHGPSGELGAIRTSTGWAALKHRGGLWTAQHRLVAAWSVG